MSEIAGIYTPYKRGHSDGKILGIYHFDCRIAPVFINELEQYKQY
jgi:hypothetical protein